MIEYNTSLPKLEMREYGRHIKKLVDYCLTIEDREERTKFAQSIADVMTQLFPELKNGDETMKIVWNHLNMISGFKLYIDFPCEVLDKNENKKNTGTNSIFKKI